MSRRRRIPISEIVRLYHEVGGSHAEVARILGCSREYIRQVCECEGLPATRNSEVKNEKMRQIFTPLLDKQLYEISNITGYSFNKVRNWLKKLGLKCVTERECLTKIYIESYNKVGGSYVKMAEDLGKSQHNISKMMKRLGLSEQYPATGLQREHTRRWDKAWEEIERRDS